jgi:hypothetical protein
MHLADARYPLSPLNRPPRVVDADVPVLAHVRPLTKVCIYGAGAGAHQAPLDDPEWTVWALNLVPPLDGAGRLRCDLWFDLHQREAQTVDDLRWIAGCPVPVVVPPDLRDIPGTVSYPLARVEARFGAYWACTFAYQIAWALLDGVTDLGLFGVELAQGDPRERTVEWANVSWWAGYAEALGVRLHLPDGSRIGQHPARYGFEYRAEIDDTKRYVATWQASDVAGAERAVREKAEGPLPPLSTHEVMLRLSARAQAEQPGALRELLAQGAVAIEVLQRRRERQAAEARR